MKSSTFSITYIFYCIILWGVKSCIVYLHRLVVLQFQFGLKLLPHRVLKESISLHFVVCATVKHNYNKQPKSHSINN